MEWQVLFEIDQSMKASLYMNLEQTSEGDQEGSYVAIRDQCSKRTEELAQSPEVQSTQSMGQCGDPRWMQQSEWGLGQGQEKEGSQWQNKEVR